MIPAFHRLAAAADRVGVNATSNGCAALLGASRPAADPGRECVRFNDAVLGVIRDNPAIKRIVLAGRWAIYATGRRYKYESGQDLNVVDAQTLEQGVVENPRVLRRALLRTLSAIAELDREVVIIAGVPEIGWDTPNVLAKSIWRARNVQIAPSLTEHRERQQFVIQLMTELQDNGVQVLWPADLLCPDDRCKIAHAGQPLYVDEDHLSSVGAKLLEPLLGQALN